MYDQHLLLNQKKYAYDLLERANLLHTKSIPTPIVTNIHPASEAKAKIDDATYRSLIDRLQYLTMTKPDILYVNYVSQFMKSPTNCHLSLVKKFLRYVQGTIDYRI